MRGSPGVAHGFGQRFDLPLPLWLWLTGAGATIVLTFALVAVFLRKTVSAGDYPRRCCSRVRRRVRRRAEAARRGDLPADHRRRPFGVQMPIAT